MLSKTTTELTNIDVIISFLRANLEENFSILILKKKMGINREAADGSLTRVCLRLHPFTLEIMNIIIIDLMSSKNIFAVQFCEKKDLFAFLMGI